MKVPKVKKSKREQRLQAKAAMMGACHILLKHKGDRGFGGQRERIVERGVVRVQLIHHCHMILYRFEQRGVRSEWAANRDHEGRVLPPRGSNTQQRTPTPTLFLSPPAPSTLNPPLSRLRPLANLRQSTQASHPRRSGRWRPAAPTAPLPPKAVILAGLRKGRWCRRSKRPPPHYPSAKFQATFPTTSPCRAVRTYAHTSPPPLPPPPPPSAQPSPFVCSQVSSKQNREFTSYYGQTDTPVGYARWALGHLDPCGSSPTSQAAPECNF
jgi:hypothetical protein